jgi:phytanoyl-CoA hydroxylase
MRTALTADEVDRYRSQGFLCFDDFLDEDELSEWREAVDQALADRERRRVPHRVDDPSDLEGWDPAARAAFEYYDGVFTQRLQLWRTSERVRDLVLDPRLGRLAAQLEGVDAVRLWQDQALVKEPWAHPTSYHLDGPIFAFDSPHCVSFWVALDDATTTNGCLAYIPGTHTAQSVQGNGVNRNLGGLFEAHPEWAGIDPVFCPVPAGGVCIHNGFLAHGAGANMTKGRRRAMTAVYIADGVTRDRKRFEGWFSWDDDTRARYQVGDRLDGDAFPLVYPAPGP